MAFVLVPVFFLLGLLGVVICHVLKKKGYRCTTEPQDGEEHKCEGEGDPELGEGTDMFSAASKAASDTPDLLYVFTASSAEVIAHSNLDKPADKSQSRKLFDKIEHHVR